MDAELRQEFLALPPDQWSGKAYRTIGEYMKQSGMADQQPDKVWDHGLASLKSVLLGLGRPDIFKDVSDWLERTCKPYWDDKKREVRAAKSKSAVRPPSHPEAAAASADRPENSSKEASNAPS